MPCPEIYPAGDSAYVVEFGDTVDLRVNRIVLKFSSALANLGLDGLLEAIPTYRSLLVQFDPLILSGNEIVAVLRATLETLVSKGPQIRSRLWQVPTCYDPEFGVDLEFVADTLGLSVNQVVSRHSNADYSVFMIGFAPGYAYLGGLPPELSLPRRLNPRSRVEAGSIAIGGVQACILSNAAPSGWHILGRTPLQAFQPERMPPCLFEPGDRVKYVPITRDEYDTYITNREMGEDIGRNLLVENDQIRSEA
ncbi:MAG: 5-oxoprolinase subunit PxpB [Rhodobacteraceae bacterium]|nr:5-oxoprolinase subunit PxpB [Paracoccaceae bacterium]